LGRWSGQHRFALGAPISGRTRVEITPLVGFFVETAVVPVDLGAEPTFADLVARARSAMLDVFSHRAMPFERLVEVLQPARDVDRMPLFDVIFNLEAHIGGGGENADAAADAATADGAHRGTTNRGALRFGDALEVRLVPLPMSEAKFDLGVLFDYDEHTLMGSLQYRSDLFDAATVARMAEQLMRIVDRVLDDPERPIRHVDGLDEAATIALTRVLARGPLGSQDPALAPDGSMIDAFAARVRQAPDAPALTFFVDGEDDALATETWTYGALARAAAHLTARLRAAGVGVETRVEVLCERHPARIVAILAVLAAGGTYVPIDPGYPAARRTLVRTDSGVALRLVTAEDPDADSADAAHLTTIVLDPLGRPRDDADDAPPDDGTHPADALLAVASPLRHPRLAAYVMYTSGSTGRPKGIVNDHGNLLRLAASAPPAESGPGSVYTHAAPIAFDASSVEVWTPLLTGGRLVLLPPGSFGPVELRAAIACGVTTMWLTTELFHRLVDLLPDLFAPLRHVLAGGDVVSAEHVRRLRAAHPHLTVTNGYGPT
ncbi:MAG: AMP-binding protein, partial [Acidobacteriota bacterium]